MLNSVSAVRNAEAKLKVKALEDTVSEEMLLNHPELAHWFVTDHKLNPGKKKKYTILSINFYDKLLTIAAKS